MATAVSPVETLDDLMRYDGKAELINGRVVPIMPSGVLPIRTAKRILRSLDDFVEMLGRGEVFGDCLGYGIKPPLPNGREAFCPDVSYFAGKLPANLMKFIFGAPTFAVEVRSENDYGPAKDQEYEDKRDDYFSVGTLVVWDVDPKAETVSSYTISAPSNPMIFHRGETADAEPAVPGWTIQLDDMFNS
jgi:Uma2 family endonuclease